MELARSGRAAGAGRVGQVWRSGSFDRTGAALYDAAVEREWLFRPFARLIWGTDWRLLHEPLRAIEELPPGSAVLDVPCGGGWAFRALRPERRLRYVGVDLSPGMLRRARSRAERRRLGQVELVEASVDRMPFEDGSFDLCLCLNGLHCMDDPRAALREMARCLRPGGRLVGDVAVRGALRRSDLVIHAWQRRGAFGPVGTEDEVRAWFESFERVELRRSGAVVYFDAVRDA